VLTYLLDTSAWLTHVFNEPGCQRINTLFDSNGCSIGVCVLSLIELQTRLKALDRDGEFERLWTLYRPLFDRVISVDEALVARAIALKRATPSRLPSIDALIAAAAALHEATLVHRDAHFQAIPVDWLQQEMLGSD